MKSLTLYPSMLASYHTVSRTGEIQGDKTSGSVSITYEQGQYLRHNPPVDGVPVESVDWGIVGKVTAVAVGVGVAVIAITTLAPLVVSAVGAVGMAVKGVALASAILAFLSSNEKNEKNEDKR